MIARAQSRFAILGLFVAACSTSVVATPTPKPIAAASPVPTAAATAPIPTPSPEPTLDSNGLPPTTTTGWWGDPDGTVNGCAAVGHYRIGYRVAQIGTCDGMLGGPPELTLDVGEDFDLHMTIPAAGASPIWSLPVAEDELVAIGWLAFDPATWTYRALSPGTTRLVSGTPCDPHAPQTPSPTNGCPILLIHVRPIATKCIDLAADVCRAVGAAAVLADWVVNPGQRIVGWVAEPDSFIGDASCGDGVAKVTFTVEDPAGTVSIQIGRRVPEPSGPPRYHYCTY